MTGLVLSRRMLLAGTGAAAFLAAPAINSAPTLWAIRFERSLLGKREFIQRFGRANWGYLCQRWPHHIVKRGKRAYVTAEAVEDQLWEQINIKMID